MPSPNYGARRGGKRPDMILLHYTGMGTAEAAARWLANPEAKVSTHYLVEEDGTIVQMVSEWHRAWHAGASYWAGERDINSVSIGIEIHNHGHEAPDGLPPYPRAQMEAVVALCRDIAARWSVPPERVLGHSDVAPGRKVDPGEHFDWQSLAREGVCVWVPPVPLGDDTGIGAGAESADVEVLKAKLARVGYGVTPGARFDEHTASVVAAFQRRFRPEGVHGRADTSTLETLDRLIAALDGRQIS
ncbi:N-acetylmuramoyl-L-alanine amidase [Dichotomicrobium thermohalophilum]|nr:N-acetylmuramoyl-L-alanine amidase [Dichotomicrobium thermohalophilum]